RPLAPRAAAGALLGTDGAARPPLPGRPAGAPFARVGEPARTRAPGAAVSRRRRARPARAVHDRRRSRDGSLRGRLFPGLRLAGGRGGPVLLDARGRAARGVEDAQQPQRSRTEVLHAVDLAAGQEDARAAADGGPAPPGPHPPTPFEDAQP